MTKFETAETTARQAVDELQNAQEYSQLLINSSFDIIIACDVQQRITQFNPAAEQAFGYTREEALGQQISILYSDPDSSVAILKTILRWGGTVVETQNRRKNGEQFTSVLSASMLRNEQGEHIGIMGISRDITEQKQAEEALAVERERLVTTISGLAEGVITTDDTGKIVLLNPTAARLLEISENDALGQELWAVYHHENADEKELQAEYEKVLCGEEAGGKNQRCVLLTSSGKQLPVSENIMALNGADNEVAGLVAVFRDIKDEIRLQAEHTRAEKLESISVFAGGLAHDFNNFLASFSLNISLAILHSNENPKLKEILKNSEASIQMAKGLTKQLAALSRDRHPSKIKQDIRPLLRESVTYALRGTPVEPVFQLADDLWPSEFDISQLNQVIHNLAINAKKAMPDGGRLTVSADNFVLSDQDKRSPLGPGNYNRISFQDSGSGIDVETMEKIFDPYFSTHKEGTGLELYFCHMIMEMHCGWITVDPEVDKGSRFTFYLPVDAAPHVSRTLPESQLSDMGQRLLLVNNDNPGNETTTVPEELG